MDTLSNTLEKRWREIANLFLGVWLAASPWALGYLSLEYATWNAWALGAIIGISALAAIIEFHEWEEWVTAGFGAWLAISPWVLGFTASAAVVWNSVAVGGLVVAMACATIWNTRQQPQKEV